MAESIIVPSFLSLLSVFSDCFTGPSFCTFQHHTTTNIIEAAGVIGLKHHTSFHRFFRKAAWAPDAVGVALLGLLLKLVPPDAPLVLAIEDTLARHTGKRISSAGMHRDPLLSTATKAFFHFGHVWVVLAVVIKVPHWNKTFALPVLARLYRSVKVCGAMKLPHRKKTELALELVVMLQSKLQGREIVLVGDNAFANRAVLDGLAGTTTFVGRGLMNAAVFERPWTRRAGERGRARVRGNHFGKSAGKGPSFASSSSAVGPATTRTTYLFVRT